MEQFLAEDPNNMAIIREYPNLSQWPQVGRLNQMGDRMYKTSSQESAKTIQ